MGSSTNIGFVYRKKHSTDAENELSMLLEFLISNNGKILTQKYCQDLDGDGWVESNEVAHLLVGDVSSLLVNNYYGQLRMNCDILGKERLDIDLYFKMMEENHFGILLDVADDQIFEPDASLEGITNCIIEFMKKVYSISHFDYSFCDNEAQIEYSLQELMSAGRPVYSIVALPDPKSSEELKVTKSDWNIDGLTSRNR